MKPETTPPAEPDLWEDLPLHMGAPGLPEHIAPESGVPAHDVFTFLTGATPPVMPAAA